MLKKEAGDIQSMEPAPRLQALVIQSQEGVEEVTAIAKASAGTAFNA